jgi:uncharacterized protein YhbP (UPF0306 family)
MILFQMVKKHGVWSESNCRTFDAQNLNYKIMQKILTYHFRMEDVEMQIGTYWDGIDFI